MNTNNYIQLAQQYKEEGNEAFLRAQYNKAVELYSKAIELDPTNAIFFNNRSQAYYYLEELDKALLDCNASIQLNPEYVKAMNNKAHVLLDMGNIDEALQILENIQRLFPKDEMSEQLLRKLKAEQSQFVKLDPSDPESMKHLRLIDWLKLGQAEFPKLKIEYYSKDYRGVHAIRKVKAHEVILYVPKSHLITLEMAKETSISKKILQYKLDLLSPKHSHLSTFLLQEKINPNSYWKPYLDILPENYSGFPIFFSEEELKWLQGSPFLKQVREKIQDLHKDYDDICMVAPEFAQYSFFQFCWARMTASSRIFGITINGVKTDAFVPLADMLNHRRPKQTSWMYSDDREGFIIETDEEIDRGQMIFDSYGRKCNSRFLLNYGFIVEDNDANEVAVSVPTNRLDPLILRKEQMMQDQFPEFKAFRILEDVEEGNVQEFQGYIRFLVIDDHNHLTMLQRIQMQQQSFNDRSGGYRPQKTPPISIELESMMWQKIKDICQKQLDDNLTTLKDDLQLLKSKDLTQNQRNCVLLRSGEKQILSSYVDMAERMLKILTGANKKELIKFMHKPSNGKYMPYVNKVILPLLSKLENDKQ